MVCAPWNGHKTGSLCFGLHTFQNAVWLPRQSLAQHSEGHIKLWFRLSEVKRVFTSSGQVNYHKSLMGDNGEHRKWNPQWLLPGNVSLETISCLGRAHWLLFPQKGTVHFCGFGKCWCGHESDRMRWAMIICWSCNYSGAQSCQSDGNQSWDLVDKSIGEQKVKLPLQAIGWLLNALRLIHDWAATEHWRSLLTKEVQSLTMILILYLSLTDLTLLSSDTSPLIPAIDHNHFVINLIWQYANTCYVPKIVRIWLHPCLPM